MLYLYSYLDCLCHKHEEPKTIAYNKTGKQQLYTQQFDGNQFWVTCKTFCTNTIKQLNNTYKMESGIPGKQNCCKKYGSIINRFFDTYISE